MLHQEGQGQGEQKLSLRRHRQSALSQRSSILDPWLASIPTDPEGALYPCQAERLHLSFLQQESRDSLDVGTPWHLTSTVKGRGTQQWKDSGNL